MCIGKKNKEIQPFFIVFLVGKSKLICFSNFFFKFFDINLDSGNYITYIQKLFSLGLFVPNFILFEPKPEPHDLFIFSRLNKCCNGNRKV